MSNPSLVIRKAWHADIPDLLAMQERSMWALGRQFYSQQQVAAFLDEIGTMDPAIVLEGGYFVAETFRGVLVGCGGWSRRAPGYAQRSGGTKPEQGAALLRSVFVDPGAARQGIGSAVVRRVEQDAAGAGITALRLTATLSGAPLYQALGYRGCRRLDLTLAACGSFACIEMEKRIAVTAQAA